jgi:hypothetical protein
MNINAMPKTILIPSWTYVDIYVLVPDRRGPAKHVNAQTIEIVDGPKHILSLFVKRCQNGFVRSDKGVSAQVDVIATMEIKRDGCTHRQAY